MLPLALLAGSLATVASPAPAGATTTGTDRAVVTAVSPPEAADAVAFEVLDGDGLVELTVRPGHAVEVLGYEGEPWLRFADDGRLEENVASPAGWLNDSADGTGPVPPDASADAEPRWEDRGERSSARWHDHRVHDMGQGAGAAEGLIAEWEVALVVDGRPAAVQGRLERLASPSPAPWIALGLAVAVAGSAWARRAPVRRTAVLTVAAAALATATAVAGLVEAATVATADVLPLALGAAGLLLAVGTLAAGRDAVLCPRQGSLVLLTAGLVAASVVPQASALVHPVIVSALPDPLVRAAVALAGGALVATASVLTWTGLGATATSGDPTPAA